jgi:hypothetical protein
MFVFIKIQFELILLFFKTNSTKKSMEKGKKI